MLRGSSVADGWLPINSAKMDLKHTFGTLEEQMFKWLKDAFRFDGIQDKEIPSDSDWHWLTPMERIGIQTQADADIAKKAILERKREAWMRRMKKRRRSQNE